MTTSIIATDTVFSNYIGKGNFLGAFPEAIVAYSLRAIGTRYIGPVIRIRRSSDSQEKDFYAHFGSVNIDEVKAFVGPGTGFVSVWYDQSGNGLHAFQPVPESQPMVIKNGTVILFNSKNCLMFDGVDDCLQIPEIVAQQFNNGAADLSVFAACIPKNQSQPFTVFSAAGRDSLNTNYNDLMIFQANPAYVGTSRQSAGVLFRKVTGKTQTDRVAVGSGAPANNSPVIFGITRDNGSMTISDTSTTAGKEDMSPGTLSLALATIGATRRGVNAAVEPSNVDSKVAELVIYRKSYDSVHAEILKNMADYYVV